MISPKISKHLISLIPVKYACQYLPLFLESCFLDLLYSFAFWTCITPIHTNFIFVLRVYSAEYINTVSPEVPCLLRDVLIGLEATLLI